MNCACIDVEIDGDPVMILGDRCHFASREHVCDECGRTIAAGELYRCEVFVCQGDFGKHKTCPDCQSIRQEMFCGSFYYGCIIPEVREYIGDIRGDLSENCLAALTPGARAMVCEMIEAVWQELEEQG